MASWIPQYLRPTQDIDVCLDPSGAQITWHHPEGSWNIDFYPCCREEANHMAISLRLAAKRVEEVGKGMPHV
jgi:hypothetical protein